MTGASPWSVKGISAEERELAKQAARRAGVPIGQWLSRQIREAAEAERSGRAHGPAAATTPEGRFGHAPGGWRGPGEPAGPPPSQQSSPTAAAWRSALATAPAPLAPDLPHPPPAQYSPVQYAPMQPPSPRPPAVDPGRIREVERRVRDLAELEGRVAALEKVERRLGAVAGELSSLSTRLEEAEKRADARSSALTREVKALEDQVEELRSRPAGSGDAVGSIAASTAPIERAVMRLAERLQRVEELTLPQDRAGRGLLSRLFRR